MKTEIFTIYKATNTVNRKSYIGITKHWPKRKGDHIRASKNGSKHLFHIALRKYGIDVFEWEVISTDGNYLEEKRLITEHNTFYKNGHGYNMTLGGEGMIGVEKKVTIIDKNGNSFGVTKEEFYEKKDIMGWRTHSSIFNKNRVTVEDSNGNRFKVSCNDPRIGQDLKIHDTSSYSKGTVPVFIDFGGGKCIRVPKNDPKILSGEYVLQCKTANLGKIKINDGNVCKSVKPEQLKDYLGWNLGMLPRTPKT